MQTRIEYRNTLLKNNQQLRASLRHQQQCQRQKQMQLKRTNLMENNVTPIFHAREFGAEINDIFGEFRRWRAPRDLVFVRNKIGPFRSIIGDGRLDRFGQIVSGIFIGKDGVRAFITIFVY